MKIIRKLNSAQMLCELAAFRNTYGHIRVNLYWNRYPELAGWIIGIHRKLDTLTYDQILSLYEKGFFNKYDSQWLASYEHLRIFQMTQGHCNVPEQWPKNPSLGAWVARHRNKRAKIPLWRRKLLKDLGFCFSIRNIKPALNWNEGIRLMNLYKERFGHCNVIDGWDENPTFGRWVSRLRAIKKSLGDEKIKQLDDMGFSWNPVHDAWEQRFRELQEFQKRHGHCRVYSNSGKLGVWVSGIRQRKEKLSQKRLHRLNQLGFDWDPVDTFWNNQYENLLEFKRRFGHVNVPKGWKENTRLSEWVALQRAKKTKITPQRKKMLEDIGFDFARYESIWMQRYEELKAYQAEHGHCRLTDWNSLLGSWVSVQRRNRNRMPLERKKLLDAIDFVWYVTPSERCHIPESKLTPRSGV